MNIQTAFSIYIGSAIILSTSLYLSDAKLSNAHLSKVNTQTAQNPHEKKHQQHFELNLALIKPETSESAFHK